MLVLADENQHPLVIARLRQAGIVVEYVRETSRGVRDSDILRRPDIGSLILVTDDRDFGELIFHRGYPAPAALLYNRLNRVHPDIVADRLLELLAGGAINGHITTIMKDGERRKPFPPGASDA